MPKQEKDKTCVVVFSGGTDSMCVAALKAEEYTNIHLLTFYDYSTKEEPLPLKNVELLKTHFPQVNWVFKSISTDSIIRFLSYKSFIKMTFKFGLFNVMTPAFSSMSWHCRTIKYCIDHKIEYVFDGMTNEMTQLPGHMSSVMEKLSSFYKSFNISFESPVRDWSVPEDQDVLDRVIVDQHGFLFPSEEGSRKRTTGEYLFKKGIFNHPNIKGSQHDRQMQHDCYPFVLYNILAFWYFLSFQSYEKFSYKVASLVECKLNSIKDSLINSDGELSRSLFATEENHECN